MNIDPNDIKPGDRVRVTLECEIVVDAVDSCVRGKLPSRSRVGFAIAPSRDYISNFELVERPKPEAKLGSVWVDPVVSKGRVKWVALDEGIFVSQFGTVYYPHKADDAAIIARLVPDEGEK